MREVSHSDWLRLCPNADEQRSSRCVRDRGKWKAVISFLDRNLSDQSSHVSSRLAETTRRNLRGDLFLFLEKR
jgi:hypothetical protein